MYAHKLSMVEMVKTLRIHKYNPLADTLEKIKELLDGADGNEKAGLIDYVINNRCYVEYCQNPFEIMKVIFDLADEEAHVDIPDAVRDEFEEILKVEYVTFDYEWFSMLRYLIEKGVDLHTAIRKVLEYEYTWYITY